MLDIASLIAVAVAFFVAAASPGPATIALATVSMHAGRKAGLRFGTGLSVGLAFWGLIAATGLGAVLQASAYALSLLKLFGGLYLLWLAYNAARSVVQGGRVKAGVVAKKRDFNSGLLLNLSNPKAVFAWMAALALGLDSGSGAWSVISATALCIALGFIIYAFYALIFSTPGAMMAYARVRRWIEGLVAGLFVVTGFGLIRSAFSRQ